MKNFTILILNFFDFFYKLKLLKFLKKIISTDLDLILDVGAHKGESIDFFLNNFNVNKIISFEASPENFKKLINKEAKYKKKFSNSIIQLENIALGSSVGKKKLKQFEESSSSTMSKINEDSKYFKKKFRFVNLLKKKENFYNETLVNVDTLDNYIELKKYNLIDLVKIDTEGSEFEILKGVINNIKNIKLILFEHHYDDMIIKDYNFTHINRLLEQNNFTRIHKAKMPFRKTFEYVYMNKFFKDDFKF